MKNIVGAILLQIVFLSTFAQSENADNLQESALAIDSEPSGAMVYIDGVQIGKTPVSSFYPSGTYTIKLTSDNYDYDDIEETIVISGPETKKAYQLTDIRATLTINTCDSARVYLNGARMDGIKDLKLAPQRCVVKVEMNKAKPLEEVFILKKKEKKTLDLYPQLFTGTIMVAVTPQDAEIELTEASGEKYFNTGSKSFSNIITGSYNINVSRNGFKTFCDEIALKADGVEKVIIKLEEGSDDIGDYIFVEGGTFQMGNNNGYEEERPVHNVNVNDFYICKTEVTQALWRIVMGTTPSNFIGDDLPVENVSWNDAVEFCKRLSRKESAVYRLPTEAEWEYAARGGKLSKGNEFPGISRFNDLAWWAANSGSKTNPAGKKKPNELGIYDMNGNVYEWCSDYYRSYNNSNSADPTGSGTDSSRVMRGGSWTAQIPSCTVTSRNYGNPDLRTNAIGFRVVRDP
ncbi:MAG TPA: formylglycine-generating enzyme family protein [Clostridiales bacterium]|nr:formylglycine-generating enzyme family protein [Clostridiales bacterium]HQP68817.1 formylglycine-generating enzyme family protein [Clostridiales bacterium]